MEPERVAVLASAAERLHSPLVSERIAFVRADGVAAGHLLPVPRTGEALQVLVTHVCEAPVPLALEHISALLAWPENAMTETDFLLRLLDRTDALLLDLANLAADATNFGVDPLAFLDPSRVQPSSVRAG